MKKIKDNKITYIHLISVNILICNKMQRMSRFGSKGPFFSTAAKMALPSKNNQFRKSKVMAIGTLKSTRQAQHPFLTPRMDCLQTRDRKTWAWYIKCKQAKNQNL